MQGDAGGRDRAGQTAAVLRALAALAPDRRAPNLDRVGSGPTAMAWLGTMGTDGDHGDPTSGVDQQGRPAPRPATVRRAPELEALARHDALTPDDDDLRIGWLWVVGRAEVGGVVRPIRHPLLSRPVRLTRSLRQWTVTPSGPWDLWPLVEDRLDARRLEQDATFGGGGLGPDASQALVDRMPRLRRWADDVVSASGLPPLAALLAPTDPRTIDLDDGHRPVAVAGYGLYVDQPLDLTHPSETLRAWSRDASASATALAALYLDGALDVGVGHRPPPPHAAAALTADLPPTLPLDDRQAEVVLRARRARTTVVSGPPGTGKSQTAAAVALDCVARGESVLLATRSTGAADVLADLLARLPGPDPVLFGGRGLSRRLAAHLADGLASPPGPAVDARYAAAHHRHAELELAVRADLDDQAAAAEWERQLLTLGRHALVAPHLLDPAPRATIERATALLHDARRADGLLAGLRRRRAERALRTHLGAPDDASLDQLAAAIDLARLRDRAGRAARRDPPRAQRTWDALVTADRTLRHAAAEALAAHVGRRADGEARRAVAALSTALRAGRATRRAHLGAVDVRALTAALPLWVGTLGEIEALLPATAGAFDVVLLDEASQIDQFAASAALLRARRAVVIGDPRQLRFVSFVPDAQVAEVVAAQRLEAVGDRLDVRRVSAFDLAAGAAPVTFLDEHYRSVPHLIGFSAERFYDGRLRVATRHPRNHDEVAIEVRRLDGAREAGVNEVEVAAAIDEVLARLDRDPTTTIGVVSPYRQQVEAIESRLGDRVDLAVLQSGRVRVGTVHAFQGAECDVVVASFGIGGSGDRGRAFLEDPNLFNVLVTRARHRLVVLSSGDEPSTGLLADYLRWSATAPTPPPDRDPDDPWTARLAEALRDAGLVVRAGYPVGRHVIDLVIGDDEAAVAVTTRGHPDGTTAHLHRYLALARGGWRQAEAFAAEGDGTALAAALALAALVPSATSAPDAAAPPSAPR